MNRTFQPDGIALVFTDIVNSTELRANFPAIFSGAKIRHDSLIRTTLADWRGEEINTGGDSFFLTFRNALNATHWAKAAQSMLLQQTWPPETPIQVRIGLHFGNPTRIVHPDGRVDYEDTAVNIAQRIMSAANGGEIFVSQEFFEQVRGHLPFPFAFRERGFRDLRGIGERPVWQLAHPDLPSPRPILPTESRPRPRTNIKIIPNAHFYGRENACNELRGKLERSNGHSVALIGMGGIGKTQMAAEYAHAYMMDYPDGVFWLDARSNERLLAEYIAIGQEFFGLNPNQDTEQAAKRVCREMQQLSRPALIVFDNVMDTDDLKLPSSDDLDLLPSSGNLHLLFTTQRQALPANCAIFDLPCLEEADALRLLQVYRTAQNEAEVEAAVQIVQMVGCLPLALAVAAHDIHVRGRSFVQYWKRLKEDPHRVLDQARIRFISGTGHIGSIYDTIDLAVRGRNASGKRLSADALKTLDAAACFAPNEIPQELLRKAAGIRNEDDFEEAMISLWNRSLLKQENERQSIHELIRIYALAKMTLKRRNSLLPRVLSALTDHLYQVPQAGGMIVVRNDIAHCYAAVEVAKGCSAPPVGLEDLLWEMVLFLAAHRENALALTYAAQGAALATAREGDKSMACAKFLRVMSEAQQESGDAQEALHNALNALCIARRHLSKNASELADYCNSLGYVLKKKKCYQRALPFYRRALVIHEAQQDMQQIATVLNNIGTLHEDLKDLPAALGHLQRAVQTQAAIGENVPLVIYLNNTGRVLSGMKCWEDALPLHERARRIAAKEQGLNHPDTGSCHYYLAEAQRGLGQRSEALANYRKAKKIYEKANIAGQFDWQIQNVRSRLASLEAGEN